MKKNVLIIGAGKSGSACARLLFKKGFSVFVSDKKDKKEIAKNLSPQIKILSEEEAVKKASLFSFAVKSPGLKSDNPVIISLLKASVPIRSELETALNFSKTKNLIMITGTNGKTTTTALCAFIMSKALKNKGKAYACGNIGYPVSLAVAKARENDFLVIEASSYQLEDSRRISPLSCAILNITPDHIEHHGSLKSYVRAKEKIFKFQNKDQFCILNREDKNLILSSRECPSKVLFFSLKPFKGDGAYLKNKKIFFHMGGKDFYCSTPKFLIGNHNIQNAMAAALCAISCKAKISDVKKAFSSFKGIEHRIEFVRKIKGVSYYNDSKATNVDSVLIALKALGKKKNIWLILGGRDKMAPYSPLLPLIKKYVKTVLTVGEAAEKIEKTFSGSVKLISAKDIFRACDIANNQAKKGDIVLLSPACASYDQFSNFEERGKKFKDYVLRVKA
ncbi:MAG: UDP-N-acetylmuramoyl-L-alanine--D-glutamate ligase [Elusimicrobia bacterium]|nr:UDP-N-acetylmuramoyl-L-alanine--D-glutamate ligase [Elusimicrobiota bacterium]